MGIQINKEDSDYMQNFIQRVIDEAGCRIPGSIQEKKGAEIVAEELKQITDEVITEPFEFQPNAFLSWIRIDIACILASMLLFFIGTMVDGNGFKVFLNIIALILQIIAFYLMWKEFFNYEEYYDKLFKTETSQNVIGKIKPKEEVKNIIIFSGHIDSALQFNILRYFKYFYPIIAFWGLGSFIIWLIIQIVNIIFNAFGIFGALNSIALHLFLAAIPAIAILWFFVTFGQKGNKVPGAADNLSAIAIIIGLGKYLKIHPEIIPKNTEIRLVGFGCEEAGLRGAYRYVEKHFDELKKLNAVDINMDTIMDPKWISVTENEPTTRTKHSKEICDKIIQAAASAQVDMKTLGENFIEKFAGLISGGTDAAAFSKAGLKATNLVAVNYLKFFKFYHQEFDTLDKIKSGALENTLKILIAYLKINEPTKFE
jgi:aminopeptidase YwaD